MIAVTGASGYIGGRVLDHLRLAGAPTVALGRRGAGGANEHRGFALGQSFDPRALSGVTALVHAAWDFTARGAAVRELNVLGALPLLHAAEANGARVILISSLSAFVGCRSDYGAAKLELESLVLAKGGVVLRPGIVYGESRGGIFGTLADAIARRSVVPLLTGRRLQRLFLSEDSTLCELVSELALAGREERMPRGPVLAAYPQPTSLHQFVLDIAAALGRPVRILPVPWYPSYLALRLCEEVGLSAPFRADSVLALANPIPLSEVAQLAPSQVTFAPPRLEAVLAAANASAPRWR